MQSEPATSRPPWPLMPEATGWHEAHSLEGSLRARAGWSEPCGAWQVRHLPLRAGVWPCRASKPSSLAWHPKHRSAPVVLSSLPVSVAWGSWQDRQSPSAKGVVHMARRDLGAGVAAPAEFAHVPLDQPLVRGGVGVVAGVALARAEGGVPVGPLEQTVDLEMAGPAGVEARTARLAGPDGAGVGHGQEHGQGQPGDQQRQGSHGVWHSEHRRSSNSG